MTCLQSFKHQQVSMVFHLPPSWFLSSESSLTYEAHLFILLSNEGEDADSKLECECLVFYGRKSLPVPSSNLSLISIQQRVLLLLLRYSWASSPFFWKMMLSP